MASRCGPKVRLALLFVLEGCAYREAARRAGLPDHKNVFRAATCHGLRRIHMERKLRRDAVRYSGSDLTAIEAVIAGTASARQSERAFLATTRRVEQLEARGSAVA